MAEETYLYHWIGIAMLAVGMMTTLMGNIGDIPVLNAAGGIIMLVGFLLVWKFGPKKQNELEILGKLDKDEK
jgi:hypothetical protein